MKTRKPNFYENRRRRLLYAENKARIEPVKPEPVPVKKVVEKKRTLESDLEAYRKLTG
jgi:hypothetical protein